MGLPIVFGCFTFACIIQILHCHHYCCCQWEAFSFWRLTESASLSVALPLSHGQLFQKGPASSLVPSPSQWASALQEGWVQTGLSTALHHQTPYLLSWGPVFPLWNWLSPGTNHQPHIMFAYVWPPGGMAKWPQTGLVCHTEASRGKRCYPVLLVILFKCQTYIHFCHPRKDRNFWHDWIGRWSFPIPAVYFVSKWIR